jgi:hypothetical protein
MDFRPRSGLALMTAGPGPTILVLSITPDGPVRRGSTVAGADESASSRPSVAVIIAIGGLLSTLGAAFLGSYTSTNSVETTLNGQRFAQIQDQRRTVYADFISSTGTLCNGIIEVADHLDRLTTAEQAHLNTLAVGVLDEQARVLLIAGDGVTKPMQDLVNYSIQPGDQGCEINKYLALRDAFVSSAQTDLQN